MASLPAGAPPAAVAAPNWEQRFSLPAWAKACLLAFAVLLLVGIALAAAATARGSVPRPESCYADYSDQAARDDCAKRADHVRVRKADAMALAGASFNIGKTGLASGLLLSGVALPNPRYGRALLVAAGVLLLVGGIGVGVGSGGIRLNSLDAELD